MERRPNRGRNSTSECSTTAAAAAASGCAPCCDIARMPDTARPRRRQAGEKGAAAGWAYG